MITITEIYERMTLTGLVILLLGIFTLTPEIYVSGIIVMALSVVVELNEFEKMRDYQGLSENQHQVPDSW